MKLTSKQALTMLENARGKTPSDGWIDHSICVGTSAGKIAKHLKLDTEKASTLGYIHDIGKSVGDFSGHVINGYNYLKDLGYDEEYANVCLTHSCLNNDDTIIIIPIVQLVLIIHFLTYMGQNMQEIV